MHKTINLQAIERNVFRDYLKDGLFDILVGAYFLLVGLVLPAGTIAPFVVLFALFMRPLLRNLKQRVAYPRTGYVELREGDPQALPWFVIGSFVLGLVAQIAVWIAVGVIARPGQWYRWFPVLFGIWMAGMFLGLGLRVRMARYYVVASVSLIGGPLITRQPLTDKMAHIGAFFAVLGAVVLIGGLATLARFLKMHPRAVEGDDHATG